MKVRKMPLAKSQKILIFNVKIKKYIYLSSPFDTEKD